MSIRDMKNGTEITDHCAIRPTRVVIACCLAAVSIRVFRLMNRRLVDEILFQACKCLKPYADGLWWLRTTFRSTSAALLARKLRSPMGCSILQLPEIRRG